LSPFVAGRLRQNGYDATHVRDYEMQKADDEAILVRAKEEGRVVVSAGTPVTGCALAAPDKIAPKQSVRWPAEQQHPLPDGEIGGGKFLRSLPQKSGFSAVGTGNRF
jgi:hypothetical protein